MPYNDIKYYGEIVRDIFYSEETPISAELTYYKSDDTTIVDTPKVVSIGAGFYSVTFHIKYPDTVAVLLRWNDGCKLYTINNAHLDKYFFIRSTESIPYPIQKVMISKQKLDYHYKKIIENEIYRRFMRYDEL